MIYLYHLMQINWEAICRFSDDHWILHNGFVVFSTMTSVANNAVTQNRAVGDVSDPITATANVDVAFGEPIDSMVVYYGNGSNLPSPGQSVDNDMGFHLYRAIAVQLTAMEMECRLFRHRCRQ